MFVNGQKVAKVMDELYPPERAAAWDNVGFQVGNPDSRVDRILIALEVTDAVIDEAIDQGADMILTHHPLIFKPLSSVTAETAEGAMVLRLIENRIALYAAHTNMDVSEGGTNDFLFDRLGLANRQVLSVEGSARYQKLVVYVPLTHVEAVHGALVDTGAGRLGDYEGCTFTVEGKGTFRPLAGAAPHIGEVGTMTTVGEARIEAIVEKDRADAVIAAVKSAHPYEEVAYDLIDLVIEGEPWGLGLLGVLPKPMDRETFLSLVKERLGLEHLKFVEGRDRPIRKVALCTGAGADLIPVAAAAGADVFLTGDVKYHEAQRARQLHLNLVDAGHFATENLMRQGLKKALERRFEEKNYEVALTLSTVESDVLKFF